MKAERPSVQRIKPFLLFGLGATIGLGLDVVASYLFYGPDKFVSHVLLVLFSVLGGVVLFRILSPDHFDKLVARHFRSPSDEDKQN
jgi:hypothetical protein